MASFLVQFSEIVPKSFNLPSPSSPLPSPTSAALSAAPTAALSAARAAVLSSAAPSAAAPAATRPLVPPGFMARVRAPPGFATVQPNIRQAPQAMFGPSVSVATSSTVSGPAGHEAVCQAVLGEIRTLTSGFNRMRMEMEQLRRLNGYQGTLITGLKEEERAFEENKKVIGDLEGNVGMSIDHAEEKERVLNALEVKVGKGEEDNRALRKDVGDLKEEIHHLRSLVKKIWVGASVVGGFVLVRGVVAWVRKN